MDEVEFNNDKHKCGWALSMENKIFESTFIMSLMTKGL